MHQTTSSFANRILYLCQDGARLRRQLDGELEPAPPADLLDNVSTDAITPGWACYWYDDTLGRYCLTGLASLAVGKDAIRDGHFDVVVAGRSFGCGSSRETAPFSFKAAGVRLLVAESFEKIFEQNCQNIGLYTSTDFGLLARIRAGEKIPTAELCQSQDPIAAAIIRHGGLFAYNRARLKGEVVPDIPTTPRRAMTAVEKIIAAHAVRDRHSGEVGLDAVAPGDAVFCRADLRFSHDYVTPMAAVLFRAGCGPAPRVADPESCYAFRDHLTFLKDVMPESQRGQGLLALADDLATAQARFCREQGIELYGEVDGGGSVSICHNAVLDELALPGQLVIGTDSHTCTAGALGALAFGVGATDMANAWLTGDVRLRVPESVRIELIGRFRDHVAAKDLILAILAHPYVRSGKAIGQVLELCGPGVAALPLDERATVTNMAVEAGAFTGFVAADPTVVQTLAALRHLPPLELERRVVTSDPDAGYAHRLAFDLAAIEPMVALPGDPRSGVPIASLDRRVEIDIAYGGSCTGGKRADLDAYAAVLTPAANAGRRVKDGVRLYIQFGSQAVKAYGNAQGYLETFAKVGATLIDPSCGACINAGPGVSDRASQVTVSAINRNFAGRSGPGQVYLASPAVVAASALAGFITAP
ncbi:MAG: 3-isopropylmalate dehydratase [Deltaproteobacteria bacterium]|nr:3-isopropylmalate dehydratase [Deltaproteobacteria bacterium]